MLFRSVQKSDKARVEAEQRLSDLEAFRQNAKQVLQSTEMEISLRAEEGEDAGPFEERRERLTAAISQMDQQIKGLRAALKAEPTPQVDVYKGEFSRGRVNNGTTATQLQNELDKIVGGKGITTGKVRVFDSVDAFYAADPNAQYDYPDIPSDAKAFVDPATGQAVMFAENIGKGEGLGVLLHEIGVHLGFRNLFNKAQYNALIKTVKSWAARNDNSIESRVAKAAIGRVEAAATSDEQYDDELLAYAEIGRAHV